MDCEFKDKSEIYKFIHAGLAIVTLFNQETGNRYTYKIEKVENENDKFFVSLLTGPDNLHDYAYIGMLSNNNFYATKGTKIKKTSTAFMAIEWLINKSLKSGKLLPKTVHVYHIGRCGKCGRPLTTPASLITGYGEVCASKRKQIYGTFPMQKLIVNDQ